MKKQKVITFAHTQTKDLEKYLDLGYTVAHLATTAVGTLNVQSTIVILDPPEEEEHE